MLTAEGLRNVFSVDPATGFLYWKANAGQRGRIGERAGTTKLSGTVRYFTVSVSGKSYYTHKVVWAITHGYWPKMELDHIDGNRENNRAQNLREVTHADNVKNARPRKDNKSGVRGVCWNEVKKRWIVQIGKDSGIHQVGGYRDFFEACCSRKSAEIELGYHANHGRA